MGPKKSVNKGDVTLAPSSPPRAGPSKRGRGRPPTASRATMPSARGPSPPATMSQQKGPYWQNFRGRGRGRGYGGGGRGGGAAYLRYLKNKEALSILKTRELQLASEGRYQGFLLAKLVKHLKTQFLDGNEKRLELDQLLNETKEDYVSDNMKKWLMEEALPNNPRIRVVTFANFPVRYAYKPPIPKLRNQEDLLDLLKSKHSRGEGGVERSLVEDSLAFSDICVKKLLEERKILQVNRLDMKQILFWKPPKDKDKLKMDTMFVEVFRKIDVSNKDMSQIKLHLRNQQISFLENDEKLDLLLEQELFANNIDDNPNPINLPPQQEEEDNQESTHSNQNMSDDVATASASTSNAPIRKRKKRNSNANNQKLSEGHDQDPKKSKSATSQPTRRSSRKRTKIRDNAHVADLLMDIDMDGIVRARSSSPSEHSAVSTSTDNDDNYDPNWSD